MLAQWHLVTYNSIEWGWWCVVRILICLYIEPLKPDGLATVLQGQLYTIDDGLCIFVTSHAQTRSGHFFGRLLSEISGGDLGSGVPTQIIIMVYLIPPAVKSGDRTGTGHLSPYSYSRSYLFFSGNPFTTMCNH